MEVVELGIHDIPVWQSDSPAQLGNIPLPGPTNLDRTHKTVCIRDDGTVVSLKHRDVSVRP